MSEAVAAPDGADDSPAVTEARSRVMRGNRSKDTRPEMLVRRALHGLGYRFRVHVRGLPGTPDIVFGARRAVVQVHGCFWHSHGGCRHASVPRTRASYWVPKLARNVERDAECEAALEASGWRVMVVWECEVRQLDAVLERAAAFLGPSRATRPGRVARAMPCPSPQARIGTALPGG